MSNPNLQTTKRETFSSGLAVFFATLGSAVGLGNIWKFPYLVGINGGGAFILVYLVCIVLVGMPVAISEFYIGRRTKSNPIQAFDKLKVGPLWKIIGYLGVMTSFFVMLFYSSVAGWVYLYTFKALKGDFTSIASLPMKEAGAFVTKEFDMVVGGPISPMLWQLIVVSVVSIIIFAGVKKGIEKVTKTLMPVLFVLIIVCALRALTLEGARQGIDFLFSVDFSAITPAVLLSALGLAFFKLSIGMGTMITYASYFTNDNNMPATSAKVAISDVGISMLAGLAVFPVVFTFGLEPGNGPGLLFNTIPLVFSKIPFGSTLLIAFFFLASIAATTAMTSMFAVPVSVLTESLNMRKSTAVILTGGMVFLIGIFTVHPSSLLGNVEIFGKSFFDLFDYISSNILMPIGGLLIAIFVGYFVTKDELIDELSNQGRLNMVFFLRIFRLLLRFITPILLIIIFLNSIGLIKF